MKVDNIQEKIVQRYKERLEEILEIQFEKDKCKERGNALVLFAYAVLYVREILDELEKTK